MPVHELAEMTWEEVRDASASGDAVAVLPVGAVEAHGPHLPLSTDVVIAGAMARACAERLSETGRTALVLPPIWYTSANFARDFPGTVSVAAGTVTALVREIAAAMSQQGIGTLALANAHLDPAHLEALRAAAAGDSGARVVSVDLTRRAAASRLTEEFRSGACHAGRYEGSVMLAETPELVRSDVAARLEPNPASLSDAIRRGARTFAEAGGPRAYFGWPSEATPEEGRATVHVLGELLAEAVLAESRA